MFNSSKPKIIILDDDHYPEGRVSDKLMGEFRKRKLDVDIRHYKTFASLTRAIHSKEISITDLYVIDSTLDEEPDGHRKEFGHTIPALLDMGIKAKYMMPGSGGMEGRANNQVFEDIMERRSRQVSWAQMDLKERGLSGNPFTVADKILGYYHELNPKVQLEKEFVGSFEDSIPRR